MIAALAGWALAALLGALPAAAVGEGAAASPAHVGSGVCAECHADETAAWQGSHHDLAMAVADEATVLGDFGDAEFTAHGVTSRFYRTDGGYYVRTDGPDGRLADYRIDYTFGWYPLQQYLVTFPDGRLQALGIAWDSRAAEAGGQRWFHLYPNERMDHTSPLHWTSAEQTWNYQCAECHSTNLQKGYDQAKDRYTTTWSEIDVACEACHGPGGEHVAWARAAAADPEAAGADMRLAIDLSNRDGAAWIIDPDTGKPRRSAPRTDHTEIQLCARCHSRRGQIWLDYEHGRPLTDTHRPALLDGQLYFADGQIDDEVYVYGSFLQSRMYAAGVTCSDCHDPHSQQLRADGNAVCSQCHLPTVYDTKAHHHHETGTDGASCVACHMPERVYMVNDWRADHSMRVPRPDLSDRLGTPNACNACHVDQTNQWSADALRGWYPDSAYRGPHYGEAFHAADNGDPGAADGLLAIAADPGAAGIVRASAVERLRRYADARHGFTIRRLLGDGDPLIRAAAVRYLETLDVRSQVDMGWPLLSDPDRSVRIAAARVLAPLMRQRLPDKYRSALARAIEEYAQAQMANAERPESHLNLGLVAVAVGDARQAEQAYRQALRLDPGFVPGYVNLADLYRMQQRDDDGETVLRAGLAAAPGEPDLHHSLGLLLVRQQRLDDALPLLEKAADSGQTPRYALVYALALQGAGQVDAAIRTLETAAKAHPAERDIQVTLVTLYRDRGDSDAALARARALAERYPGDAQIEQLLQSLSSS